MNMNPAWLAMLVAVLLLVPGVRRPGVRPWLLTFLATLTLALLLPRLLPLLQLSALQMQLAGPLLVLGCTLWVAMLLVRHGGLSWAEMGFTLSQRHGSWRSAWAVLAVALLVNLLLSRLSTYRLDGVSAETWLLQASLPGLVEEALFRGVLLALLDRAFTTRRMLFGAPLGYGAVVVTAVFGLLHGAHLGVWLGVWPAALLTLWLRARTGSLLLPVVGHNLWNLSLHAGHL